MMTVSDTEAFNHLTHPPATALGPDIEDGDEVVEDTDGDEVIDQVQELLAPGEAPEDEAPAGS